MIPNTAGSSKPGEDSTGTGCSFNGNSTFNGDASRSAVRTRSQEDTQCQTESRNPHSQTAINIAQIGFIFGPTADGIGKGAVALKGTLIPTTVEIGSRVTS